MRAAAFFGHTVNYREAFAGKAAARFRLAEWLNQPNRGSGPYRATTPSPIPNLPATFRGRGVCIGYQRAIMSNYVYFPSSMRGFEDPQLEPAAASGNMEMMLKVVERPNADFILVRLDDATLCG